MESLNINDLWRGGGITSSTDPVEFSTNVAKEFEKPSTWIEGYAAVGQIFAPFVLTALMTGGFGEGAVMEAEMQTMGSRALVSEPLTDQWGQSGLYATPGKTTYLIGSTDGYFGKIIDNAQRLGINLVENSENPGGFSRLSVDVSALDLKNSAADREYFWNTFNKPLLDKVMANGDIFLPLDNPYNTNAIYPSGDVSKGYNFYGREAEYLSSKGYTFSDGQAIPPAQQEAWHAPLVLPSNGQSNGN